MTAGPFVIASAALRSRAAYEGAAAAKPPVQFPEPLDRVWSALVEFYERDPAAGSADADTILAFATRRMPNPKHVETVRELVQSLETAGTSVDNVVLALREAAQEQIAHELATAVSARRPAEEISALIARYQAATEPPAADEDRELAWEGIVSRRLESGKRIKVPIKSLNDRLGGGLLPGHNVTVFARTEAGKTAFALTLACGFAKLGHKVLYVINEDPAPDLMVRAIQMAARKSREELMAHPEEAERAALAAGIGNLYIRELCPGTMAEIERLVRKHEPAVLVVDQMRNVMGARTDNFTQRLDQIAQGIRAVGKRYGLVTISVTQAGDSARGKSVLDDGDIDSSNTGIPGAADVLIGIGMTEQLQTAGLRMLSLCKNKVSFVHGHFSVQVDPDTGRMKSHD